ncbi:hypothetical protein BH11PLA2_BH11PLA2_15700 [soil metagenome]
MTESLVHDLMQDSTTASMARAVLVARRRAVEIGIVPDDNILTVSQSDESSPRYWRVNFEPKTPKFRRGGDYMIDVDAADGSIQRELRGQ